MSSQSHFQPSDIHEAQTELRSILDLARWTLTQFNKAGLYYGHGTDNPWDEALGLIAQALHLPQPLHADFLTANTTKSERQEVLELVQRRVNERKPMAYLTNQAWFAGLPFYVDERVLVPRSPFSELIENGFEHFIEQPPQQILDMCTGSACIAIACAYRFPDSFVDAVDISNDALQVADINIQEHGLTERVFPIESDLFSSLQGQTYDLIICNPPYVDAEDMADLPPEFHHEPELGLAAGNDGLDLVRVILTRAATHLNDGGWLFVEVGNSLVHMDQGFPDLPLHWVQLEMGGDGIFAINKEQLVAYFSGEQDS